MDLARRQQASSYSDKMPAFGLVFTPMPCRHRHFTLAVVKQLVVLSYVDEHRAAEVLALLQRLHTGSNVQLDNAVGVVRGTDWNVKLHHGTDLSEPDDSSARFWQGLVASLVLTPGTEIGRASCR